MKTSCAQCGADVPTKGARNLTSWYCSNECADAGEVRRSLHHECKFMGTTPGEGLCWRCGKMRVVIRGTPVNFPYKEWSVSQNATLLVPPLSNGGAPER